jgi:hypothetical protein
MTISAHAIHDALCVLVNSCVNLTLPCVCVCVCCIRIQLACRALQRGIALGQSSAAFQDVSLDLVEKKLSGLMDMSRIFPGMTSVAFEVDIAGGPALTFSGGEKGFPKITLAQCVSFFFCFSFSFR